MTRKRTELEQELAMVPTQFEDAQRALVNFEESLKQITPWWRRHWHSAETSSEILRLHNDCSKAYVRQGQIPGEIENLKNSLVGVRKARKRLRDAENARALRAQAKASRERCEREFRTTSLAEIKSDYDRSRFRIRNKDYKRGNSIENFVRNKCSDLIVEVFGGRCMRCASAHDLTLDHFAIPKNEGGNFVLMVDANESLVPNIVVLCRSCNASKGEIVHTDFFDARSLEQAAQYQKLLLHHLMKDQAFLVVYRNWYGQ